MRTLILIVFCCFYFASTALAQPGFGPGGGLGKGGMRGHGSGHFGRMAQELNLTKEQQQQFMELMQSNWDNRSDNQQEMQTAREELTKAMQSGSADEAGIRAAAKKLAALREEALVNRAKKMNEFKAILTPEQQEKFAGMREKMQEQGGGFGRRGGGQKGQCL